MPFFCLQEKKMKNKINKGAPAILIVGLLLIWEMLVRLFNVPMYVLPAPSSILGALTGNISDYLYHSGATMLEALIGMAISLVIGVIIGIIMDAFPLVKNCIYPILVVSQTVPVIVLTPIFIIYLGFGYAPKILTVVLMCFFPIVVNFCDGLGTIDAGYENLVRTYGGSPWQLYRIVKLPAAMISLLSGMKVAATYSISGAVVGEWIASQCGLGYYLIRAKNNYLMDKVFACVLMIIVLSLLMNALVKLFEFLVLPMNRRRA